MQIVTISPKFQVVKVGKADAKWTTDNLQALKSFVVASENMYPSIERWFKEKVMGQKTILQQSIRLLKN